MAFIQIIDFRTSRIDEGQKLVDEYRAATEGKRTVQRALLCEDRDQPGRYLNLVFFESYEAAMKNSNLPETQKLSEQLQNLADGPPAFINLEVLRDEA